MKPIDKLRVQMSIMGENWLPGKKKPDKSNLCNECEIHPKDYPSKLCQGCNAYKEHQQ